jgi:hypothetical protein
MPSNPQRHCVFVEKTKSKTKAKKENKNGDQRMSKPNRLNSAGSGHVGPHRTMREREVPSGAVRALQKAFVGTNVVGEGPSMRPLENIHMLIRIGECGEPSSRSKKMKPKIEIRN